jgi:perosamine synthetase
MMPNQKIRDQITSVLWSKSLGVGRLFIEAISNYDYLKPYFKNTNVSAGQQFAANTMIISNSPWLTDKHFNQIYRVLNLHLK